MPRATGAGRLRSDRGSRPSFPRLTGSGRRLGATGPASRRRRDRADPGGHLADGVPVDPAAGRARRLGRGRGHRRVARGGHRTRRRPATACWSPSRRRARSWASPRSGRPSSPRTSSRIRPGRRRSSSTLLVEPRWGRRGHGSRLLAAVVDLAARPGAPGACRCGCPRPTRCRPASTSRPGGRPTAGPGRWTPATRRCARSAGTHCLDDETGRRRVSFEGFPDEGLVFYEGLEADNSKTYWTQHKAAYDASRPGTAAGAARGARPRVRDAEGVPPVPRRAVQQRQDALQDAPGRGRARRTAPAPAPGTSQISADGLRVSGGVLAAGVRPGRPLPPRGRRRRPGPASRRPRSTGWPRPASSIDGRAADAGAGRLRRGRPRGWTCCKHKSLHASRALGAGGLAARPPGAGRASATPGGSCRR